MKEKFVFQGYRINEAVIRLNEIKEKQTFRISPRFDCKMTGNEKSFSVYLTVVIDNTVAGEATPFDLKVGIAGNFVFAEQPESKQEQMAFALNTIFPYLRSFVAMLTVSCGIPVFYLPFIDVELMAANLRSENEVLN